MWSKNFWNSFQGLPIKEEGEEDPNNSRAIEPTTFVNVSLACDEAGPSGLQQQKIADIPEMVMSQAADVDPKTGWVFCLYFVVFRVKDAICCGDTWTATREHSGFICFWLYLLLVYSSSQLITD